MEHSRKWLKSNMKLNATELAKLEKDGLEVIHDIERFAQQGLSALTAADYDRLKWLGVYVQRPKEKGFFLLRVKIPGGSLTAEQAEIIADIGASYARNTINLTTRQCVEFHWLTVEMLPMILKKLAEGGLSTLGAAGDCPRNIIGNPLAGIDPDEFLDATSLVHELNAFFQNNADFSNLPRKFKIGIAGDIHNSINAELNDLAFVPAVKEDNGRFIKGFAMLVGGGLSQQPQLAVRLPLFVLPEQVVKVADAVATIFRDFGYREKRNHARLKFLLADWGPERFVQELLKLTGPLLTGGLALNRDWDTGRLHGIHPQKQPGLYYWGLSIAAGKITPDELRNVARIASDYGAAQIRTTNRQGLIITNIQEQYVSNIQADALYAKQQRLQQSAAANVVACPGKEFCPFALAETKGRIAGLAAAIDETFGPDLSIRIHISGCGHSCGQTQIADIGLQGVAVAVNGQAKEAFEIWVGGRLGETARLGTKLPGKVEAAHVKEVVIGIIRDYLTNRFQGESFSAYVDRKGTLTVAAVPA